jgi:Flp pilus assembly protein TadD
VRPTLGGLFLALALAGCATAYSQGHLALREERWDDAARQFEEALGRTPHDPDALVGLGVARYKAAAFDHAVDVLGRAVREAPRHPDARLYLGLSYVRLGRDDAAAAELRQLLVLGPHARLVAQTERALGLLRRGPDDELRVFIAASLEDEALWSREVREARRAPWAWLEPSWVVYWESRGWYPYGWYPCPAAGP